MTPSLTAGSKPTVKGLDYFEIVEGVCVGRARGGPEDEGE